MAKEKDGEVLPLTEHDDCTHWIGKMDRHGESKRSISEQVPEANPKREGRFGMGGLFR